MRKLLPLLLLLATFRAAAQTVILSESFNAGTITSTMPTGWTTTAPSTATNFNGTGVVTWQQVPTNGFGFNNYPNPAPNSGAGMAGYESWWITSGDYGDLISPALNFAVAGTHTLDFWVYQEVGFCNDNITVYVNTSNTVSGATSLGTIYPVYTPSQTGWVQYTVNIPTTFTGSTNYIIFRATSAYGYDLFIDDVTVTNNPPTPCTGAPLQPAITTAAMAPASPLCAGSSMTLNAVDPNFPTIGGITYQWQSSPSLASPSWANVTAGSGATTLSYTTGALSASTYFRIGAYCAASGQTTYSNAYYVIVGAPQPGTISGPATFCPGDPATYSVPNVVGTTYSWTLPSGWSGSSTTNTVTVTPGATAGTISVTATSSCGVSVPQTRSITLGNAPSAPANISGNNTSCAYTNQIYSIAAAPGASAYNWTVPAGWTVNSITNGGLTLNVTTGTASGNVTVSAANGCGASLSTLPVTVITSIANPGTIYGPSTVCSGALYTYYVNPTFGATAYQWTLPSGWTGAANNNSIQVFAGSSGTISVTASSACATSPTTSMTVTSQASVVPAISVSTADSPICQNTPILFSATATNGGSYPTYVWRKNGIIVIGSGTTYLDNKLTSGDVITATLVSTATCRTADSTTSPALTLSVTPQAPAGVSIVSNPVINICAGNNVNFSTIVNGAGSSPTYQWYINSSPVPNANGPVFSTTTLRNDDTVTVSMVSSAVCPSLPLAMSNKVAAKVNNLVVPTVTISASSTVPGQPVTFTATQSGGGATPVYQWMLNNVEVPGAVGDTYTATLRPNDRVAVRLQSYDPCASPNVVLSKEVAMDGPASVAGVSNWEGAVNVYPNPNSGRFTVGAVWDAAHNGKRVSIDVLNIVGQTVYHSEVSPDKAQWHFDIQLSEAAPNGHYILRLSSQDGMTASKQFILNR